MTLSFEKRSLLAIGALALGTAVAGCSSSADLPNWLLAPDDSGGSPNNGDGSAPNPNGSSGSTSGSSGVASGAGGTGGSTGSGVGGSSGSNGSSGVGGTGAGSGAGSSSGAGGVTPDAGDQGGQDANAGGVDGAAGQDATTTRDAGANADTGSPPGNDAGGLCADQAVWLAPMNAARAAVNAGEPPLVCDPIAAQVALNYANKCNYAHNMNRSADYVALGGKGGLGENIAAGAPTESISGANASWINEQVDYNHATNTCAAGKVCGHYTQVVWKATTGVGCAHVSCTTNSPFGTGFGGGKWDFSVCDFSPPGNFVGQPPY